MCFALVTFHSFWGFEKTLYFFSCQNQHLARTKGTKGFKCLLLVWEMQLWYYAYNLAFLFWNLEKRKKEEKKRKTEKKIKSCLKSYDRILFCLMWNVHLTSLLSLICLQNTTANLQFMWFPFPNSPPSLASPALTSTIVSSEGEKKGTWSIKMI